MRLQFMHTVSCYKLVNPQKICAKYKHTTGPVNKNSNGTISEDTIDIFACQSGAHRHNTITIVI